MLDMIIWSRMDEKDVPKSFLPEYEALNTRYVTPPAILTYHDLADFEGVFLTQRPF